jgi:hypothetical protein
MIALLLAAATTFDVVTYSPPAGFQVETGKSVTMSRAGAAPCEIDLFASVKRASDFAALFRREWTAKAGKDAVLAGDASPATLASGLPALGGIGQGPGGSVTMLTVVDGGTRAVSVRMQVPSVQAVAACQQDYASVIGSLSFAGAATPAPAPTANGVAAGGPPALGPVPATLRASDLAGKWVPQKPLEFATVYYSRSTGAYAGSDASFAASSWTFDARGNFTYAESGLTHGQSFSNTESGSADIADGMLTLHGDSHTRRYRLLGYESRAGTTFLRVLPDWADPSRQIDLDTYGEYLVRSK